MNSSETKHSKTLVTRLKHVGVEKLRITILKVNFRGLFSNTANGIYLFMFKYGQLSPLYFEYCPCFQKMAPTLGQSIELNHKS